MAIPQRDYVYDATMMEVIDGETVQMEVDLGCGANFKRLRASLFGIAVKNKEAAKHRLQDLFPAGSLVRISTRRHKEENSDRYQVILHHPDVDEPINDHLINLGFAQRCEVNLSVMA